MIRFGMLIGLTFISGCAAKAAEPPAQATPEVAVPATWKEAHGKEQKAAFMKAKIVPPMAGVFQAYDAKGFAEFDCKTCHGPDYKDPKQFLPGLTFKDGKFEECADEGQVCQFMGEKVVPAMAQAMGLEPYNMETHQGFGCAGCHAVTKQ